MNDKFKFKLKVYLKYLILEPWTRKAKIPNLKTISWAFILTALLFRNFPLLLYSILLGIGIHLYTEWKSGSAMHWYRNNYYKKIRKGDSYYGDN